MSERPDSDTVRAAFEAIGKIVSGYYSNLLAAVTQEAAQVERAAGANQIAGDLPIAPEPVAFGDGPMLLMCPHHFGPIEAIDECNTGYRTDRAPVDFTAGPLRLAFGRGEAEWIHTDYRCNTCGGVLDLDGLVTDDDLSWT